jgi:putative phosphoesterase
MRVGLISDTHGLVRPEALDALRGSEVILHAGDIGGPHVLAALETIAKVHAIRGNVDEPAALRAKKRRPRGIDPDWAGELPASLTIELAERRVHVVHAIAELAIDPSEVDVIVSGHSHVPSIERRDGVLYVNPGSAGPRRFRLPIGVARLVLRARRVDAELITL